MAENKKEALQELLREIAENLESIEQIQIKIYPRKVLQGDDKEA